MLKLPEDVRQFLVRRFQSKHREWLIGDAGEDQWPLEVPLGIPTEQAALRQVDGAERVNDFASPCFMNLLWKPGCSSRRFAPLRVG